MTQIFRGLLLATLSAFLLPTVAEAGHHEEEKVDDPLAAAEEFPLLLRRTTLIVRDIEASLKLYRDGLGMEVIYDQEINRPHSTEDREQRLRLIFLKASHEYVGVRGLIDYEYGYPDHPAHTKPVRREGEVVVVVRRDLHGAQEHSRLLEDPRQPPHILPVRDGVLAAQGQPAAGGVEQSAPQGPLQQSETKDRIATGNKWAAPSALGSLGITSIFVAFA